MWGNFLLRRKTEFDRTRIIFRALIIIINNINERSSPLQEDTGHVSSHAEIYADRVCRRLRDVSQVPHGDQEQYRADQGRKRPRQDQWAPVLVWGDSQNIIAKCRLGRCLISHHSFFRATSNPMGRTGGRSGKIMPWEHLSRSDRRTSNLWKTLIY